MRPVVILLIIGGRVLLTPASAQSQSWQAFADTAAALKKEKKPDQAIAYYLQSKEILDRDSAISQARITIYRDLAGTYYSKGRFDEAAKIYQQTLDIISQVYGQSDSSYATVCYILGAALAQQDKYPQAEPYALKARDLREKWYTRNHILYIEACILLGNIYVKEGDYRNAESQYINSKHILEQLERTATNAYAQCCNGLAYLYMEQGEFEKAEPLALLSRQVREAVLTKKNPAYAFSCITLANIYTRIGQYEKAEALYLEAKDIREKEQKRTHPSYSATCNALADLYYQWGEYEKAEPLYLEARELRSQPDKNNFSYGESCNSLGNLYLSTGELKKAEAFALEAKEIWTATLDKDDPNFAINNNMLGNIYTALGEYTKARDYFLSARKSWEVQLGKNHPYYADNTTGLAEVNWNLNHFAQADKLYSEALRSQYESLQKVFLFTNEKEKANYLQNVRGSGDEYLSFMYLHAAQIPAGSCYETVLANRNLILSSSRQIRQLIHRSGNDSLLRRYEEWMGKKQLLAGQYANPAEASAERIRELEEEADLDEKAIVKASLQKTAFTDQPASWRSIHAALQQGEACIEFAEFPFFNGKRWTDTVYYIALLMRKDRPSPILIKLFEKRRMDSLIRKTGNTTNDNVTALYTRGVGIVDAHPVSGELYKLIWQPIEKYLAGINRVYFAPAGLLHRIAFAALPINSRQLLSDRYRLLELASTSALIHSSQQALGPSDKIFLYGGVAYDAEPAALREAAKQYQLADSGGTRSIKPEIRGGSWSFLPGTVTEIEQISALNTAFPVSIQRFTGIEASEESVKALDGKPYPAVLHFASHGFFFPSPPVRPVLGKQANAFRESGDPMMRSGILLAGANNAWSGKFEAGVEDGLLTSYEVSNLYLPSTKLVVLSACETALGDIQGSEGVYGLQRAFKMAGVDHLVMSLWKVPDAETAEFMKDFYKNLFEKQSISDAFYHTQQKMKDKYRNSPFKWAAWILVR